MRRTTSIAAEAVVFLCDHCHEPITKPELTQTAYLPDEAGAVPATKNGEG